jgi:hypothetical protein
VTENLHGIDSKAITADYDSPAGRVQKTRGSQFLLNVPETCSTLMLPYRIDPDRFLIFRT